MGNRKDRVVKSKVFIFIFLVLVAGFLYQAGMASAKSGGISGYSGNPATSGGQTCSKCHGGGLIPTVTLSGPTTVFAGTTNDYTLTITGGQQIDGSLDVSVTGGTLAAIEPGTQILNGELTQTMPKVVDGTGAVSFSFHWTAPPDAGTVTMYGAGLSSNADGRTGGDMDNKALLAITVQGAPPVNQPPVSDADGPYSGIVGSPVQFNGSGSYDPDGTIVSYHWDFGDGLTDTVVNPTHTYGVAGIYNVSLTVTDNGGLSATDQTVAEILAGPTPTILRFHVPGKVGVTASRTVTRAISVTAELEGVAVGTTLCGTAYLDKNGASYLSQPLCVTAGNGGDTAKFEHTFTTADSPSVSWTAYVVVAGAESQHVTKVTEVTVR